MLCGPTISWDQRRELFIPPTSSSHTGVYDFVPPELLEKVCGR